MDITRLTPDEQGMVEWPTLSEDRKAVVSVGVFDGFHLGHRAVISRVVELARQNDAFAVVVMFDPRPGLVHRYAKTHNGEDPAADVPDTEALTDADERLRFMEELGVDHVMVVRYTLAFAAKSYRFFLGQMVGKLGMRALVLGSDAAMGNNREGDVRAIANLAAATGVFELEVVDDRGPGETRVPPNAQPIAPEGWGEPADPFESMSKAERRAWSKKHQAKAVRVWSSTNVRYLLSQGRVKDANAILGHAHAIEGTVVHGEERGRSIGFPTANLGDDVTGYLPVDGVYAGWLADGDRRWPAAISIGTKPTFSEKTGLQERVVEAYALADEWLDLYGHHVRVEFVGFLRPQVKFDGPDELAAELKRNVEETKRLTA
ncbi:bifunctional riboflavin kinase/FMN adenylyltransferase [Bifidobacterium eulemuris]|uniref:Bifunctional riboflavin kinase/FMN adenylyltransferase n=1 Tax=Bifidobacterium eulemuris TaxID=1765219 RepID=A0A261G9C6_9BIFI|nr:riboflavin kinase [Bifidobacterium eulemuris]OZG68008.1 bifunctional riboflavin kinase/FMN adenylyltransferase [Bifidobacterium eulemuris]QOL31913.1 bifunctional riboflavin kinase/FMN adenylyltransferase [Bifidobacterium eulemuris]